MSEGSPISEADFNDFSKEELAYVQNLIHSGSFDIVKTLEDDIYRVKPPTPEEFLDEWLGPIKESIYPAIRKDFLALWNPDTIYNEAILYGGTRTGKSSMARLCILYFIVRMWSLKDPHAYLGISKMSSIAIYLMCFSKTKAEQLLLQPIINMLKASPKFQQITFVDKMQRVQDYEGIDKIVWTTASRVGEIEFAGNIHLCLGSNPSDIIGVDIVLALISEINFFIEVAGITEEDVWNVYTLTRDRIKGTVGRKYGAMVMMDSSANIRDSIIEEYILGKAADDKNVFYRTYSRWDTVPQHYPIWQKTGETFKVFVGDSIRFPMVVGENFKFMPGDDRKIVDCPIDGLDDARKDVSTFIKNQIGLPTGRENLFFPDMEFTYNQIFDMNITNVTRPVEAPLYRESDGLVWNQVWRSFMEVDIGGRYILKRARTAPRWIRIDLSEASDRTGVAMCHPEMRDNGTIVCVFDFAFDIKPLKDGINLDAVKEFVRSLYIKHNINIVGVSSDTWQSSFFKQEVMKDKIPFQVISVDKDKTPYMVFKSKVLNGLVKVGYYINIYNNLKSLIETKDKVDHYTLRKDGGKNKDIGLEAKDIADGMAGACQHMFNEINQYSIPYNYDDITRNIEASKKFKKDEPVSEVDKSYFYSMLLRKIEQKDSKLQKDDINKMLKILE